MEIPGQGASVIAKRPCVNWKYIFYRLTRVTDLRDKNCPSRQSGVAVECGELVASFGDLRFRYVLSPEYTARSVPEQHMSSESCVLTRSWKIAKIVLMARVQSGRPGGTGNSFGRTKKHSGRGNTRRDMHPALWYPTETHDSLLQLGSA